MAGIVLFALCKFQKKLTRRNQQPPHHRSISTRRTDRHQRPPEQRRPPTERVDGDPTYAQSNPTTTRSTTGNGWAICYCRTISTTILHRHTTLHNEISQKSAAMIPDDKNLSSYCPKSEKTNLKQRKIWPLRGGLASTHCL